ncbi:diguanylate cyclase [Quadrisphaera sp. DSM 44207]|uniref:GGDEF domain-containing protein n=1 Tax=Quadrisphaera sp. DSM 44207 TaxID=1881057 RepID=UPI000891FDE7|nr:sensor domain-containing diguanylate cyclase [Quadrisphaera sp. DSM 44207]SDQ11760.1 diguanylate cyclase (GGDEF) domain-containing protein [Quadrisphaera sp. DSM 44207]
MSAQQAGDVGLVPLMDRIRGLEACRPVLAVGALVAHLVSGAARPELTVLLLVASGAHLALTLPTLLAPRLRRASAVRLHGLALLLDGVHLAVVAYGVHGYGHPVLALLLVHLVSVTLLGSFRSGLKVAVWNSLLMAVTHQLQLEGVVPAPAATDGRTVVLAVAGVWLVTTTTAVFAAANERELRRRTYDAATLARFSLRLEASLEPAEVAATLAGAVTEDFGLARAVVLGPGPEVLERLAGAGDAVRAEEDEEPGAPGRRSAVEDHMVRTAIAEHRSVRVPRLDPARDPWLSAALPGARNLLLVPLYADGTVVGVLAAEHGGRRGARVERRALEVLERYASHAALALSSARLLVQVRRQAETDGLTGVANRRTFDRTLAQELARGAAAGQPVTLVMVDIDHFKRLNDAFGHQTGDLVLKRVAHALETAVRRSDLLARYGGEEFAVVVPGASPEEVVEIAERLRAAVREASSDPAVTASFGVATAVGAAATPERLLAAADQALYRSKEGGRDRVTAALLD